MHLAVVVAQGHDPDRDSNDLPRSVAGSTCLEFSPSRRSPPPIGSRSGVG